MSAVTTSVAFKNLGGGRIGVDGHLDAATVKLCTGASTVNSGLLIAQQVSPTHPDAATNPEGAIAETLEQLSALAPRDGLEGMLAAQMIALNNLAMAAMGRASHPRSVARLDQEIDRVTKLTKAFARQAEVLQGLRSKGNQRITVEHVTVNASGQAVVGAVCGAVAGEGL